MQSFLHDERQRDLHTPLRHRTIADDAADIEHTDSTNVLDGHGGTRNRDIDRVFDIVRRGARELDRLLDHVPPSLKLRRTSPPLLKQTALPANATGGVGGSQ